MGSAPTIVLVVGLTFLIMATVALIGQKYGEAMPDKATVQVDNETLTTVAESGEQVANANACNFNAFTPLYLTNASGGLVTEGVSIDTGNYTYNSNGQVWFKGVATDGFNNSNWNISYTFAYSGTACNVTEQLQTEIGNNTSIAGIVLTISLVGIILSVLIGVFVGIRGVGARV